MSDLSRADRLLLALMLCSMLATAAVIWRALAPPAACTTQVTR